MKRKAFVRRLLRDGCLLLRSGRRHDVYWNPRTGAQQPVPRHTEIDEALARHVRKHLGLDGPDAGACGGTEDAGS